MRTSQCGRCLRYRGDLTCDAFPDGIPEGILTGIVDHADPVEGDDGKRFRPIPMPLKKADNGVEAVVDTINEVVSKDAKAYQRVKAVLKRKGYRDEDFEEGGPLYGWSVNQLIDLVR